VKNKTKISVITPSKNNGRFLKDTIDSILMQTCKDWEHIIIDGDSTDETLDILKQYSHIRWISEKDKGIDDAFLKGLAMAAGEYILWCCVSDGYLDKNWFKKCIECLDNNSEISLVWGIDQNMLEDGTLHKIVTNSWFDTPPPSKTDYIYYWLRTKQLFHERDMCVRKNVLKECFPLRTGNEQGCLMFAFNFNTRGYLPQIIPVLAAYGRLHNNASFKKQTIEGITKIRETEYQKSIKKYIKKIKSGEVVHRFRDGSGKLLPYKFDLKRLLDHEKENGFKKLCTYFVPPIFPWFINKLLARFRVYLNIRKIRKELNNNSKNRNECIPK